MNEIQHIVKAFDKAHSEGKKSALATVVHVDGSSYRRPGARMLVTDDGELTGAISGGCLEGDARRKALLAIHQQKNKLVKYDTSDPDDLLAGIQLGCNGIIYILFEPLCGPANDTVSILRSLLSGRQNAVVATLFSLESKDQPGTSFLYKENELNSHLHGNLHHQVMNEAQNVMREKQSVFSYFEEGADRFQGFVEFIAPPISLIIAGAGNDVFPMAEMAAILGWRVTIADGRPSHATSLRFPTASRLIVCKPSALLSQITSDERTAFVLMTHHYQSDIQILAQLIALDCPYIGVLGPASKLEKMMAELYPAEEPAKPHRRAAIYGPIGLDIGAETAEEIALSVVAEIKKVLACGTGASLRTKTQPIHLRQSVDQQHERTINHYSGGR